jgi:D-aminopeptidase
MAVGMRRMVSKAKRGWGRSGWVMSASAVLFALVLSAIFSGQSRSQDDPYVRWYGEERPRARDIGIEIGIFPPGKWNAITDVEGVLVGHATVDDGADVHTGVTAILPHGGNLFREKVPAAVHCANAFGKARGLNQVEELGEIETPILLTQTLNVPRVADALVAYMLERNPDCRSVNPVVGETNGIGDTRGRHVGPEQVVRAITEAKSGPVEEGSVGAGRGTGFFGWKGGIGTASRVLPESLDGYTVGVLVQTNYGGILTVNGAPVGRELSRYSFSRELLAPEDSGSCMIVVATDAPLSPRNLKRLCKRAMYGLVRTGSYSSNGSGDYVIVFSTTNRITGSDRVRGVQELANRAMSPLFQAVLEATEEAALNSMCRATDVGGVPCAVRPMSAE